MAKSRRDKTLADYVVIAISPALIMTLVGSLAFFLLEVSYRGEHETRLQWVLFWFVFAAVLVARIAMEEGIEHAESDQSRIQHYVSQHQCARLLAILQRT